MSTVKALGLSNKIKALGLVNADNNILKVGQDKEEVSGNDFIPIISLDKSYNDPKKKYRAVYKGNVGGNTTLLSEHLSSSTQLLEEVKITVPTHIRLNVRQGNPKANDKEGTVTVVSRGVMYNDKDNKYDKGDLRSSSIIKDVKYNSSFTIQVSPQMIQKGAYIDFFANDDDWMFYSVSNVHCGRVAISNTSKIGKQLTENIEKSKVATESQKLSDNYTYNNPEKSFQVANMYQNPKGMCFAISMARVSKAFLNVGISNAIKVATSGDDYIYSGTVTNNIPDKYFGYGVGGALTKNGYADLVTTEEIWQGKLEEGAMLQYWNNPNKKDWKNLKEAIKFSIGKSKQNWHPDFAAGHSVIFKGYIFDDKDNIVALWCYDYSGTQRRFEKDDIDHPKLFLGANLKDKK